MQTDSFHIAKIQVCTINVSAQQGSSHPIKTSSIVIPLQVALINYNNYKLTTVGVQ